MANKEFHTKEKENFVFTVYNIMSKRKKIMCSVEVRW